jgi:hypothetical protein
MLHYRVWSSRVRSGTTFQVSVPWDIAYFPSSEPWSAVPGCPRLWLASSHAAWIRTAKLTQLESILNCKMCG